MLQRIAFAGLVACGLVGCARGPDTIVHLSAPPGGAWTAREPDGAPVCTLPCSVELEERETLIVHHARGKQFLLRQETLGRGVFSGSIRVRREPGVGALVVQAVSGALVTAGATMIDDRRDHAVAGFVLTGIGAAGLLASERMRGSAIEELWLEKIASR
jgi:hypothetical protein